MKHVIKYNDFINESKVTKKSAKEFIQKAGDILKEAGFEYVGNDGGRNHWIKETDTFGKLEVSIWEDSGSELYSIFTRFIDIDKYPLAKELASNKYSGKKNMFDSTIDGILNDLEFFIEQLDKSI